MNLGFHPLADQELEEAMAYYEEQRKGLGISLLKEARKGLQNLKTFPQRFARIHGPYRRFMFRKYPYGIIYSVEENLLYIIAIAHLSRAPNYWHERID